MMVADAETTRITLSNRQMQRQMGYSADELRQLSVSDLHPAADLPAMLTQFERLARGAVAVVANAPMRRKDGTVFYADISGGAIRFQQRIAPRDHGPSRGFAFRRAPGADYSDRSAREGSRAVARRAGR